ncbi:MAG: hypothetical protein N2Z84_05385, partial [Atribacterota bacterium]|nr:hypothetical protein [Atribacterota bacterium]
HILKGDYLVINKKEAGCVGDLVLVWEGENIAIRKVGEKGNLLAGECGSSVSSWNVTAVIGKIVGVWRKL